MLVKVISKLISKVKGEEYIIDQHINDIDIISILLSRFVQVIRGSFKSIFFKERAGIIFIGKNVKIKHSRHMFTKSGLTIGDNCYINALSKGGVHIGRGVSIGSGSIIECTGVIRNLGEKLIIGNHVGIAQNCFIGVRGKVEIGDDCIFASNVSLIAENHNFSLKNIPIRQQGENRKGIKIGKNCWIGTRVTILDGVTIGDGCVIGAGAVVTKDIPSDSVVVGVPARVIKDR